VSAIPQIPAAVRTVEQLDAWIVQNAARHSGTMADRLRLLVAVLDRIAEIRARQDGDPLQSTTLERSS
jgi:hypothetical protein